MLIQAASDHSADGVHTISYRSVDGAGNVESWKSCQVKIDTRAPATTASPDDGGWRRAPLTVTLNGMDPSDSADRAGIDYTQYRVDGGAWTNGTQAVIAADGEHTLQYRSADKAGNVEAIKSLTVRVDALPPVTTATGQTSGWYKRAVIKLNAADTGVGVKATWYRIDGVNGDDWLEGADVELDTPGKHVVEYYSVDQFDQKEGVKTLTVGIDTGRPTTRAWAATVKRNKPVKLKYRVVDPKPSCGKATVRIDIKSARGKLVKRIKVTPAVKTNALLNVRYVCKLPKGKYQFAVYATDVAGNVQARIGTNRLTVK